MRLLKKDDIQNQVQNIIHKDTQLHQSCIDLTVKEIAEFTGPGSLDFGGSEFEPSDTERINPQKRSKEDDYGWWELSSGEYNATFNEQISIEQQFLAILELHSHARKAGLTGTTHIIEESGIVSIVINVPQTGCNIKENARLATVRIFQA